MRYAIIAAMALSLAACSTTGGVQLPPNPPAVLNSTFVDERAVAIGAAGVDAGAIALSTLVRLGKITPHTPEAQRLARLVDDCRDFINAAAEARTAQSYAAAMASAATAFIALKTALADYGA